MQSAAKLLPKLCDLTDEQLPARHKELLKAIGLDLNFRVGDYQDIPVEKAHFIVRQKDRKPFIFLPPITALFLTYRNFLDRQSKEKKKNFQDKYNRQDFIDCMANLIQAGADPNAVCEFGLALPKENYSRPYYSFPDDRSPICCAISIEKDESTYDEAWLDAKQEAKESRSQSKPVYLWQLFYASPDIDVNALFYDDECRCNVSLLAYLVGYNLNAEAFENSERYLKLLLKHPHLKLDTFCGFNLIMKLVDQNNNGLIQCLLEHGATINRNEGIFGAYIFEDPIQENEEELAKKYAESFLCLFSAPERINFALLRENKTVLEAVLEVGKPWDALLQAIKMELVVQALQECRKSNKKDRKFVENIVRQLTGLADKKYFNIQKDKQLVTALNCANEITKLTLQTLNNSPRELVVFDTWVNNLVNTPSLSKFSFQSLVNSGKATDDTIKEAIQTGQSLAVIHLLLSQVTIQDYNALFEFAMDLKNYKDTTKRFAVIRLLLQTPHCKRVSEDKNYLRVNYYHLLQLVSRYCGQLEADDPTYRILMRWFSSNCSAILDDIEEKYTSNKNNRNSIDDMDSWKDFANLFLKENYFKGNVFVFDYSWKILLNHLWKLKIAFKFKSVSNFNTPSETLAGLRSVDYWRLADYVHELAENYLEEDKQAIDKSLALNQPKVDHPVAYQLCEKKEIDISLVFNRLMRAQSIIGRRRKEFPEIKETGLQFIKVARINRSCAKLASKLGQSDSLRFYAYEMSALKCCLKYGENFANQREIDVLKKLIPTKQNKPKNPIKSASSEIKDTPPAKPEIKIETTQQQARDTDSASVDHQPSVKDRHPARTKRRKQELKENPIEQPNYHKLLTNIVTTIENKLKQIEDKSSIGFKETFEQSLATIKKVKSGKVFNKWFRDDLQETDYCKNVKSLLLVDDEFNLDLAEYKNLLDSNNHNLEAIQAIVEKETTEQWNKKHDDNIDSILKPKYSYKILPIIKEYSRESSPFIERLDIRIGQLKSYQTMLEEDAALVLRIKPKASEPAQNIPRLLGKKALKAREEKEAAKQKKLAEQEAARLKSAEFKAAKAKLKQEKIPVQTEIKSVEVKALPVQEIKQKKQGFRDNIWLDHALRHLLAIKHILASEIEDKDVKRYALVYDIFRCFQALLIYQAKGNDLTPQLNQELITNLRNMIRHRGAYLTTYDEVIKTAMELDHLLSKDLLELRKPYLMDSALTQEQVNKLVSACKLTSDPLFAINPFWLTVNNTDLYKILASYHASIKNNNTSSIECDSQIAGLIPMILSIYKQIQKSYRVAPGQKEMDAFNFTHLPNVHALKMLFAICGDLCQKDHCQKELKNINNANELKAFYQFQHQCWTDGNKIAHEFHNEGGDISINRVFALCAEVEKLNLEIIKNKISSKMNLKKIVNKGFAIFEFPDPSNHSQSRDFGAIVQTNPRT